jgi:hypothetical protein
MAYSMDCLYVTGFEAGKSVMKFVNLLLFAALGSAALAPAGANPRDREQDKVFDGIQQRRILPIRLIEGRIVPRMRGFEYLGPELNREADRYRLKFMRGGQVVWIDVDARTGQIVGKYGF